MFCSALKREVMVRVFTSSRKRVPKWVILALFQKFGEELQNLHNVNLVFPSGKELFFFSESDVCMCWSGCLFVLKYISLLVFHHRQKLIHVLDSTKNKPRKRKWIPSSYYNEVILHGPACKMWICDYCYIDYRYTQNLLNLSLA